MDSVSSPGHGPRRRLLVPELGREHLHDVGVEGRAEHGRQKAVVGTVSIHVVPGGLGDGVAAVAGQARQRAHADAFRGEADAGEELQELVLCLRQRLKRLVREKVLLGVVVPGKVALLQRLVPTLQKEKCKLKEIDRYN